MTETAPATTTTMRAVVLTGHGGVDKLEVRAEHPVPNVGEAEVLVKVGACGLNNTDINTRTGWYSRDMEVPLSEELGLTGNSELSVASWDQVAVSFPKVQGAAVVGHVAEVGAGVPRSRIGQRVMVDPCVRDAEAPLRAQMVQYLGSERDGGFAEFVAVPAINAHVIDSSLTDAELATFPCSYDTAEEMLARTNLASNETVVITGAAGGVGTALIQLSLARGARVVAIASEAKRDRILELGAHEFVGRETDDLLADLEAVVGVRGAQVAVDVVGGDMFLPLLKILSRAGRYATAGAIGGPITRMDVRELIYKDLEMHGITCPTQDTFARLVSLIEAGELRPLLDGAYPLEHLADAQKEMVKRKHFGKFVVEP